MTHELLQDTQTIRSFGTGKLVDLSQVPDEMFANKKLGDGFALDLTDNNIYAPISGTLVSVFPTGHVYGILNETLEVIVHLGIDTVQLDGLGFSMNVARGSYVEQGELLGTIDLELVKQKGYQTLSSMVVTSHQKVKILKENQIVTPETKDIVDLR